MSAEKKVKIALFPSQWDLIRTCIEARKAQASELLVKAHEARLGALSDGHDDSTTRADSDAAGIVDHINKLREVENKIILAGISK